MRGIKIFLLMIILILIVINGFIYLAWMSLERTLLSSDYYEETISGTNLISILHEHLHENLPVRLLESLPAESTSESNEITAATFLELDETEQEIILIQLNILADTLAQTFNPAWFEEQTLAVIDEILAHLEENRDSINITLDMREKLQELRQELLIALFEESLTSAVFPIDNIELLADDLIATAEIPEQFNLSDSLAELGITSVTVELLSALSNFRSLMLYWPYIFFVLFLLFSILLAGPAGGLKWTGTAVIIFSLSAYIGIQFIKAIISVTLPGITEVVIAGQITISPVLINTLADLTASRVSHIPLISAAVGLIILSGGIVYSKIANS